MESDARSWFLTLVRIHSDAALRCAHPHTHPPTPTNTHPQGHNVTLRTQCHVTLRTLWHNVTLHTVSHCDVAFTVAVWRCAHSDTIWRYAHSATWRCADSDTIWRYARSVTWHNVTLLTVTNWRAHSDTMWRCAHSDTKWLCAHSGTKMRCATVTRYDIAHTDTMWHCTHWHSFTLRTEAQSDIPHTKWHNMTLHRQVTKQWRCAHKEATRRTI